MTNIEVLKSRSLSSLQALHFWVSDSSPVVHAWATSRNHAWPTRSPCSIAGAMVSNGYMTPFMPTGRKVAIYCMYIIVVLLNPTSVWSVSLTNFRLSSHLDAPMKNRLSSRQIHQRNLPSNVKDKEVPQARLHDHVLKLRPGNWHRKKWLTKKKTWISHPHSRGTPNFLVAWQQVIFPGIYWSWQLPSRSSRNATPEVLKSQWVYSQVHQWLFLQRCTTT